VSSTSSPVDFSDLYTDLLNRVRGQTTNSETVVIAKRYINTALRDMHMGHNESFPWAERRAVLTTHPQHTASTLQADKGSTGIVGPDASTAWNVVNAFNQQNVRDGGKIVINGGPEVYEIVGDTLLSNTAVMSSPWVKDSAVGLTYVYFEDEYELASDFLRPVDVYNFSHEMNLELLDRNEFRRRYIGRDTPGRPHVSTIIDGSFDGSSAPVRKLKLHPPPDEAYQIPYHYVTKNLAVSALGVEAETLSANTDEPIVPLPYRHVIVLHAYANFLRDRKDDERAQAATGEYEKALARMVADTEIGSRRMSIRPRVAMYSARAKRVWNHGGGRRFDTNGAFDRMEY